MPAHNNNPVPVRPTQTPTGNPQDRMDMAASLDAPLAPKGGEAAAGNGLSAEADGIETISEYAQLLDCADIAAALGGDGEGYARLMHRYEAPIARQMWRFTRNLTERDELVQEVFVEAYFSLRSYKQKAPFAHWLRTIAVRRGFRFWKQKEKQRKLVPLEDWDGASNTPPDSSEGPSAEDAGRLLNRLLQRLKPEERVVMTLEYIEGNSVEQTARLLGWTQAMVKMRAYRAKKKLRDLYAREQAQEEQA